MLRENEDIDPLKGRPSEVSQRTTLPDLGVTRSQSSRWQKVAAVPEDKFEDYLAETQEEDREIWPLTREASWTY